MPHGSALKEVRGCHEKRHNVEYCECVVRNRREGKDDACVLASTLEEIYTEF